MLKWNPTRMLTPTLLALLAVATACERGSRVEPAEVTAARQEAARTACISAAIARRAQENLDAFDVLDPAGGEDAIGPMRAAAAFARAFAQHAQLRATAFAYTDSAANHARSGADSVRYMETAVSFAPRSPERETVEGNVAAAYARDHAALRADEDHRCNWDI
ncbi:hypothetical protein BH23GEM3_BH23GEM3_03880 [soil metagenome]